jgi:hypothetical protein
LKSGRGAYFFGCFEMWMPIANRLPMPEESPNGYFWVWNESEPDHPPEIVEAWERDGRPMGFCHEAGGVIRATHWMPAFPPEAPK